MGKIMAGLSGIFSAAESFGKLNKNLEGLVAVVSRDASLLGKETKLGSSLTPLAQDTTQFSSKVTPVAQDSKFGKLFESKAKAQIPKYPPHLRADVQFERTPLKTQLMDEVREHGIQNGTETQRVIKSDGTRSELESGGTRHHCNLIGSVDEIRAAKLNGILIHVHPGETPMPLSPNDVQSFITNRQAEEIAVSLDGSISCLMNNSAPKDPLRVNDAFERFRDAQRDKLKELGIARGDSFMVEDEAAILKNNSNLPPETWEAYAKFQEANLRQFAEETGYTYHSEGFAV